MKVVDIYYVGESGGYLPPLRWIITGAQPKAGTGHKMRFLSFFQRYIVRDIPLTWDISLVRYFWECSLAHWNSYTPFWKAREDSQEKDCSFLGNNTFPNLYDALVYERKFKSEYLGRQIYKRLLKREPSIVKLIETRNRSDLSKLYTLSEPSVFFPS